jgi:hypothetical protein
MTLKRDWRWIVALVVVTLVSALVSGLVVDGWWSVGVSLVGGVATSVIGVWAITQLQHERVMQ